MTQSEIRNKGINSNVIDRKISLVKSEFFQHGTINHLATNEDIDIDNDSKEQKENNKEKEKEREYEDNIIQLKNQIEQITKENAILKQEVLSKQVSPSNQFKHQSQSQFQSLKMTPQDLFAIKQYEKISNQLQLMNKSNEEASLIIDNLLDTYIIKQCDIESNKAIINLMQREFNDEIANFNLILSKYDKKLCDIIQSLPSQSLADINKKKAAEFLNEQIELLINEKEQLRMTVIKQKESIIMTNTELEMLKSNSSNEIMLLTKEVEHLKKTILHLELKVHSFESKAINAIDYNQSLINAMSQIKEREIEIDKLTKKINLMESKYGSASLSRYILDLKSSNRKYEQIDLLINNDNGKVEQLKREKETILAIQKTS